MVALSHYLGLVSMLSVASAFPEYIPASKIPGAVRSPCPALNSLANHGFLPRDGKNITLLSLVRGCLEGVNLGPDVSSAVGIAALAMKGVLSFNLDDLSNNRLLSMMDTYFGDNHSFNASVYAALKTSPFLGLHTPLTAGPIRALRLADSTARNPELAYLPQNAIVAYTEAALFLSAMGDPITGIAKREYVDSLFEKERLPYELGWRPSVVQTNLATLAVMVPIILAAAGDPILEVSQITESTLKLAFEGKGI